MDDRRFDDLTRRLARGVSRRAAVKGGVAVLLGAVGLRGHAAAQVTQAQCGNTSCRSNPAKCAPGCVCCVYGNGSSRCRPPGSCSGGTEAVPTTPSPTTLPPTTPPPTTPPPTTTAPTTTTAPATTTAPTTTPPTTTAAPATTTGAPPTTTTMPPAPTTCTTFADCPQPPPGNNCRVRDCVRGVCGFRFLPDGFPCANPTGDPCVLSASCVSRGPSDLTTCIADEFDPRPACQRPCDTVAECANVAGQCQEMACIFDARIGNGGCQVVADPDANGRACTFECRTCAPGGERLCIPDGACQDGACAAGPRSYTCTPSPAFSCCLGQKDVCGLPRGANCLGDPSLCCSDQCPGGVCA